jgi:signal transduction histidine kinase/ActR/RegA family two-component response regulator
MTVLPRQLFLQWIEMVENFSEKLGLWGRSARERLSRIAHRAAQLRVTGGLAGYMRRPFSVFLISLTATLVLSWAFSRNMEIKDASRFQNNVAMMQNSVNSELRTYIGLLQGAAALFAANGNDVTRDKFHKYISTLQIRKYYPGIEGIGYSARIPPEAVKDYTRAQQGSLGRSDFHIWPKYDREEYHAIVFLEPSDKTNDGAVGYDMYTDDVRRAAMQRARDEGVPVASGRVMLIQDVDQTRQPGFLVFVPIYEGGVVPDTLPARRDKFVGFAYAPFRADLLFPGISDKKTPRPQGLDFAVYDGTQPLPENLLYASDTENLKKGHARYVAQRSLTVAGEPWTIVYASRLNFELNSGQTLAPFLLLGGMVVTFWLTAITLFEVQARRDWEMTAAELQASQKELRASEAKLRENARRKDEFLATLAHELRNPLAPIRNALSIMKVSEDGARICEARELIERQVGQMVRLIDDLLDVSRITRGKIGLRREKLKLSQAISSAAETVTPLTESRGQKLKIELPPETVWLHADLTRLSQVFANLLHNSSKYTPEGGEIVLSAMLEGADVLVSVKDNGIGIPAEIMPTIFEMFTQVDTSMERSQGGLGIGLTLVKRLVELHGGSIAAYSEGPGKGAEFVVRLPVREIGARPEAAPAPEAKGPPAPAPGCRILVVDDNESSARTMGWMMEALGYESRIAHDGPSAIEAARAYLPHVVLLDIGLPGMNGYDVCRAMRADPLLKETVFIAQTGWGQQEHLERSREAGFAAHLVKPIEMARLQAALEQFCPQAPPRVS